ncbi:MAG: SPOR domain-containing protein, partial [Succinivibrionaceae bacterium]|nr:SPOR domain-containing protein [Succinivibrionaceae bacterium]
PAPAQAYDEAEGTYMTSAERARHDRAAAAPAQGRTYVQVFTSSQQERSEVIKGQVDGISGYSAEVYQDSGLFRVRIGPLSEAEAPLVLEQVKSQGFPDSFIKRL